MVLRLLREHTAGTVVSLDNINDYYEVELKERRLMRIEEAASSSPVKHDFVQGSISNGALIEDIFERYHFDIVVNLAAQAGVRYSIDHPDAYIESPTSSDSTSPGGLPASSRGASRARLVLLRVRRQQEGAVQHGR